MPKFMHVILDRDGVLNEEGPGGFVTDPGQWRWIPKVLDALVLLSRAGIRLSVATNQSCVGRGIIDEAALDRVHEKMAAEAALRGVRFDAIYFCPHAPDAGCRCRKPLPGLLESAIHESGIPAAETVFIGDAVTDIQCARSAGVAPWLVRTGKGRDTEAMLRRGEIQDVEGSAIRIFDDLVQAGKTVIFEKNWEKGKLMRKFGDIALEHAAVLQAAMGVAETAFEKIQERCLLALRNKGRLLVCGNGGSAADAQHFAAELVGRFEKERGAYGAIALSTDTSIITALANDYGIDRIFSRQIEALGRPGDVLIAISTSGNSPNVLQAAKTAKDMGMAVVAMTGEGGGRLGLLAEVLFAVPSKRTARIQEVHEIFLHALAELLETKLNDMEMAGEGP